MGPELQCCAHAQPFRPAAAAVNKKKGLVEAYSWRPVESLDDLVTTIPSTLEQDKLEWIANNPDTGRCLQFTVERTCDSGAACALGSPHAWQMQGIPAHVINENLASSSNPSTFETAAGPRAAAETWTIVSSITGEQQAYNIGGRCPLVFPQGQVVLDHRKVYV